MAALLAAALLSLTVPGAALAQSAGDQQYADPLAQPDDGGGQPDPQPDQGNSGSSGSPTPATPGDSAPQQNDQQQTQAAQGQSELPRTGYPAWLLALAGGLLLASGATLRVSVGLRR